MKSKMAVESKKDADKVKETGETKDWLLIINLEIRQERLMSEDKEFDD